MKLKNIFKKALITTLALTGALVTLGNTSSANASTITQTGSSESGRVTTRGTNGIDYWENYMIIRKDGEVVFCIDPTTPVINGEHTSEEAGESIAINGRTWSGTITSEQIRKMELTAYFGYHSNPSDARYMYTQVMIWEVIGFYPTSFSGTLSMSGYNSFKSEVQWQVDNYKKFPSWHNQDIELKLGESVTLVDTNNVIQNLDVSPYKGYNFTRNGNELTITATANAEDGMLSFVQPQDSPYFGTSLVWRKPGAQTLAELYVRDPQLGRLNVTTIKKGHIKVVKTDEQTGKALEGIEFGVYAKDNTTTPVATATTNENGEAFFNDYDPTEWIIKETRTLDTYRLNEQEYSVTVAPNETTTVNVTNVAKKYRVSISKHMDEALDGSGTRVVGANIQFDLVDASGAVVQTMTTDANGYAISQEIPYTTAVSIVEHTPVGYKATQPIQVQLDTTKDNHTYHYIVENNVKKSYLQIVKTDVETGETVPASGVKFRLYKDGQLVTQQVTYPSIQTIDTFETDEKGQVTFPQQLVYGDYEIEEVQAPTGYVLSEQRLAVSITGDETVVTVKFANQPQKGELQINKTGSQIVKWEKDARGVNVPVIEERPLAGVVFELIKDGNVIEQATTDADGIVRFTNKPLGTYTYREVSAPKAYVVDSTTHEIEFTPQAQTVKVDSKSVSVHNERKNLTINFNKTFEESKFFINEQKATFGLYTANAVEGLDADSLVGLVEVTGSGEYSFTNLAVDGQFYLKEITTGEAYQLNDTKIGVTSDFATSGSPAQTVVVVETPIVNELKRGDHELVKVEANSKDRLEGVEFKLVAVRPNNDEVEVGRYTTDKDGRIVFKDLEYGRYYAQETKTLPDFLLNSVKYFFSIFGGEVVKAEASKELKASDTTTIIENEKQPKIHTEATTQSGGKKGYYFEKHIERADMTDLTIGKKYTVVATQYDSEGKVYATQEREFVADKAERTEFFEFTVPVGYTGNIVYGEDLYREGEKVAVHFDLKNEKQTVTVLNPKINTFAKIGGKKTITVGEKQELVDTLTYTDFKNGQVLVRTWLVKYGTTEVVGEPVEQLLTLDGNGEVEVKLDKIDTSVLPAGKYTIMEQVFEVTENGEKGNLISEHVDPKDEDQSFEVQPQLPNTGTSSSGISLVLGFVVAGLGFVTLKRKEA